MGKGKRRWWKKIPDLGNSKKEILMQVEATSKRIGVAEGRFVIPDDFESCNDEIAEMFGVK